MPNKHIHDEFIRIKSIIIKNGYISTIFGQHVIEDDIESLVVATYYIAKQEDLEERLSKLGITIA